MNEDEGFAIGDMGDALAALGDVVNTGVETPPDRMLRSAYPDHRTGNGRTREEVDAEFIAAALLQVRSRRVSSSSLYITATK